MESIPSSLPALDRPKRNSAGARFFFLAPLVLAIPYWWFVFRYARDKICTPNIGIEHQGVHVFFFWIMTFIPFSLICFVIAIFLSFRRRAAGRPPARVL